MEKSYFQKIFSYFLCFCYLRLNVLDLPREQVLFHRVSHVAPPCFYRSIEWTNQSLTLGRAFCVFRLLAADKGCPTHLHGEGEARCIQLVAICYSPRIGATKPCTPVLSEARMNPMNSFYFTHKSVEGLFPPPFHLDYSDLLRLSSSALCRHMSNCLL